MGAARLTGWLIEANEVIESIDDVRVVRLGAEVKLPPRPNPPADPEWSVAVQSISKRTSISQSTAPVGLHAGPLMRITCDPRD